MAFVTKSAATSEFYYACRNGLIDVVREKLPKMSIEEVDTIQGNGSTALHAACFYSQIEIVKLLLEKGASRGILNSHNATPYDEIESNEIKKFFLRPSIIRFANDGSNYMDWTKCNPKTEQLAYTYRLDRTNLPIQQRIKCIKDQLCSTKKDRTGTFISLSQTDPVCLLRAYTVESDFYMTINKELSLKRFEQGTNFGITHFIDLFYKNPAFENLSFIGKTYRVMYITHDELKQCTVGLKLMNKIFLSTTKDRKIAEEFARKRVDMKVSVLCTYKILHNRTALNMEDISEYRHEKEVLIGAYTIFKITTIRQIASDYVEIDLQEYQERNAEESDEHDDWD